jgi:predicted RNA-binding protein with PIN domain
MTIIIDGYNVLKQVGPALQVSQSQKNNFITLLVTYTQRKHHNPIIVFDGGSSAYPTQEHYGAVTVIYAGFKTTADDYIKTLLTHYKGYELLLISTDRALNRYADKLNIPSLDSSDFYQFLKQSSGDTLSRQSHDKAVKFNTHQHHGLLDAIMEQESTYVSSKEDETQTSRLSKKKMASKQEKILARLIKKL